MPNNDIQISYEEINPEKWKGMLRKAAEDLQGKDNQNHCYIVFNKQGILELVPPSKLNKSMRKLSLNEIDEISKEVLKNKKDSSFEKEWPKFYAVLLQSKVNKWNEQPNRLGRMVVLVFLALASLAIIGIPFYRIFINWHKAKEKEIQDLRQKIADINERIAIQAKQSEKIFPGAKIESNNLKEVQNIFLNKMNSGLESEKTCKKMNSTELDLEFRDEYKDNYEDKEKREGLMEFKVLSQFDKDLHRDQRFSVNTGSFSFFSSNETKTKESISKYISFHKEDPLFQELQNTTNLEDIEKILKSPEMDKLLEAECCLKVNDYWSSFFFSKDIKTKEGVLNYICLIKNAPLLEKLKMTTDVEKIEEILNSSEMDELLENERYLKVYNHMNKAFGVNEKHWLPILQAVANQSTLNTLMDMAGAFLEGSDLLGMTLRDGTPINLIMLERLPIQLKIVQNPNKSIEKIEGELTSAFAFVNALTNQPLISQAIQIKLNYSVTLKDKMQSFDKKTNPVTLTIDSVGCQEISCPVIPQAVA